MHGCLLKLVVPKSLYSIFPQTKQNPMTRRLSTPFKAQAPWGCASLVVVVVVVVVVGAPPPPYELGGRAWIIAYKPTSTSQLPPH